MKDEEPSREEEDCSLRKAKACQKRSPAPSRATLAGELCLPGTGDGWLPSAPPLQTQVAPADSRLQDTFYFSSVEDSGERRSQARSVYCRPKIGCGIHLVHVRPLNETTAVIAGISCSRPMENKVSS